MDEIREKRYNDKINHIVSCLKLVDKTPKSPLEKFGIFYVLQTSIEAMIDMIAMAVKDMGFPVKEDNKNISEFTNKFDVDPELSEKLKLANGMRNFLVHRYNTFDEEIIMDSIKETKELLLDWLNVFEEVFDEIAKD